MRNTLSAPHAMIPQISRLRRPHAVSETAPQVATPRALNLHGWDSARPPDSMQAAEIVTRLAGLARGVALPDMERVLRAAILDETLPGGVTLPPPDMLAKATGVSAPRWRKALARTIEEGLLTGSTECACVVAAGDTMPGWTNAAVDSERPVETDLRAASGLALAPGEAPWDVFPLGAWSRLHERAGTQLGTSALRAGHPAGWAPLRRVLATRLAAKLGRPVPWQQLLILPSRRAALRLVAGALVEIGGQAWIESPGDPAHVAAIVATKARPVGLPVDQSGLNVTLGRELAPSASLAVTSLGASIPTAARLSQSRRILLDAWARETGGWFIEDDLGGNLLLDPTLDLTGLCTRSVLIGSFGKLAAPGVDLAYVFAPAGLAEHLFAEAMQLETSTLHQATMHAFFTTGALDMHVERLRMEATARFDALWHGVSRYLGATRAFRADALSFTATIDLGGPAAEEAVLARCRAAGFGAMGLSAFCDPALPNSGLVVGFGGSSVARIEIEAARLGILLRAQWNEERSSINSARFFT